MKLSSVFTWFSGMFVGMFVAALVSGHMPPALYLFPFMSFVILAAARANARDETRRLRQQNV